MAFSIIIGLGNPGRQYEATRHNVGFMLLDRIATNESATFESLAKWQAHVAKLRDGTLLVKPQTFMNASGMAVTRILRFHRRDATEVLVIYDDVSIPLGSLRFREKGSAGGHNGVKSLIQHLGSDVFARLKLGIGAPRSGGMTGHVLGTFSSDERDALENMLATAVEAVQFARSQGIASAANRYHQKPEPAKASDDAHVSMPDTPHPPIATCQNHEPQIPRPDRS